MSVFPSHLLYTNVIYISLWKNKKKTTFWLCKSSSSQFNSSYNYSYLLLLFFFKCFVIDNLYSTFEKNIFSSKRNLEQWRSLIQFSLLLSLRLLLSPVTTVMIDQHPHHQNAAQFTNTWVLCLFKKEKELLLIIINLLFCACVCSAHKRQSAVVAWSAWRTPLNACRCTASSIHPISVRWALRSSRNQFHQPFRINF